MRVQITDKPLLSSISIASLRSYLESREWTDDGLWGGGRAILYVKESAGRSWDILVPTRDTVGDYASGMADALAVLADVEDRSQLDIFQDLTGADAAAGRGSAGETPTLPAEPRPRRLTAPAPMRYKTPRRD